LRQEGEDGERIGQRKRVIYLEVEASFPAGGQGLVVVGGSGDIEERGGSSDQIQAMV
jgi:hypothetical protein